MTKYCKEKQMARIGTMIEQIRQLKAGDWKGNKEQTAAFLTNLQQETVVVGTVLETDLDDLYPLVADLEQVCEIVYQISIRLEEPEQTEKLADEAEKILRRVNEAVLALKPRKEVAFLPYQVSMWDSLESVWMEASGDTEADCYVVPIPYYDVLSDNSLGTLHDQSDEYPDYVTLFSYKAYPLEERHPDVIFFHNPYDGCNMVTRVPEKFYASQLKKCTEQLVYIPYFASQDPGPSDHQCYMPGVLFADKVVVQPGLICDTYHRVYTQQLKENGWEGKLIPAEEKFLPLGSPKFDKIFHTKCVIERLPESWQSVIRKSDGSRKKIILYNLTLNTFLANSEQELKKVCSVFELFQQKRDEAALLWRPHPLLLSTITALRPHLKEVYLMLVQQCKEGGWGIYDESPDPNLSMVLSDAYYGDWSSLLVTYRATEKPVMIQNLLGTEEVDFLSQILKEQSPHGDAENTLLEKQRSHNSIGSSVYWTIMQEKG